MFDPDEAVQEAIRLVFTLFEQYQSALAVVSHFAKHQLRFPTRHWGGACAGELEWVRLCHGRVLDVLHSPLYAGAYVYGRTQTRRHALPGEEPRIKGRTRRVKQEDWPIVLLESHPGEVRGTSTGMATKACPALPTLLLSGLGVRRLWPGRAQDMKLGSAPRSAVSAPRARTVHA